MKLHRYSGRTVVLARYQDLCRRDVRNLCNGLHYFIEDNLFAIRDNPQILVSYLRENVDKFGQVIILTNYL